MAFQLFSELFKKIDTATATFITDTVSKSITAIAPIMTIGLTLSFIAYGWLIIRGVVEMPITDFMGKIIKISIIISIALTSGFYQAEIAAVICKTPDELINALVLDSVKQDGAATAIDYAADKGFAISSKAFDHSGFFVENGITYCVIGIVTLMATGIFVALGGTILILSKLILSILAGIGPFFILALLWQPTVRFFEMWVAQVVNYILLGVLTTMIFGLLLSIYNIYMEDIKFDGVQNVAATLGGAVVLSVAMIIILLQVPTLASALSGGISLSHLQELRMMKGGSRGSELRNRKSPVNSEANGDNPNPSGNESKPFISTKKCCQRLLLGKSQAKISTTIYDNRSIFWLHNIQL